MLDSAYILDLYCKIKQYSCNSQIKNAILSLLAYFLLFLYKNRLLTVMLEACFVLFAKFYLSELLLLVAVVTAYYAQCGIHGVEDCSHWLIVGDALGVVALHDAL